MKSKAAALGFVLCWAAGAASDEPAAEYRKALPGYRFEFPRDYFDHREFRTEWWYYTGNLRAADGRRFGYELTFFRHGVDRSQRASENVWSIDDVWLAHFAVSDLEGKRFRHAERMNRSGSGLAGVDAERGLIWNGNWRVEWRLDARSPAKFSMKQLRALAEGFRVDLEFRSEKPPVLHGIDGVSQKSAGAGRASHYVSLTRLLTRGSIEIEGERFEIAGLSWMDHEFFTHALEANQSGWDWLSLQFEEGSELMLYRLRRKDGSVEPYSSATYVGRDGRARHLRYEEFTLEPGRDVWVSPESGGRYPLEWRVRVPSLGIDAITSTRLRNQELVVETGAAPVYWEGAVDVRGTRGGRPLTGRGYVEMTGYAGEVRLGE
ncbi:MAG: lipocalin-like domain-containing protein [Bryobacteraceae bacterium]